jgi:hypothetical protein
MTMTLPVEATLWEAKEATPKAREAKDPVVDKPANREG